ncbi:tetraspanin-19-like isoform X3 [Phoenix dactylifera]|uniref:Tetraspanin-19-like isoform X3 n=1 Tax=Phoenix dactylifera TaxID=42345 RepID=A0A8B9A6V2_PHODC|nr:tetraspanin-19-like isoform X3 [Phoenix dactylifera]
MVYCPRCWLHHGIRVLNLVANFFGMGMIVYSLWLLKLWREGLVEEGASSSSLPRPWFIYAFLGLGIVACFNALIGHMVSVLVLDIVLWALGPPPRNHCGSPATPNLRCSFLVLRSDSPPALPASAPVFARRIQSSSSAAC